VNIRLQLFIAWCTDITTENTGNEVSKNADSTSRYNEQRVRAVLWVNELAVRGRLLDRWGGRTGIPSSSCPPALQETRSPGHEEHFYGGMCTKPVL